MAQDGYLAPPAEDRLDDQVLAAAAERGYRLATWCVSCGRVLSARASTCSRTCGPVCRSRADEAVACVTTVDSQQVSWWSVREFVAAVADAIQRLADARHARVVPAGPR